MADVLLQVLKCEQAEATEVRIALEMHFLGKIMPLFPAATVPVPALCSPAEGLLFCLHEQRRVLGLSCFLKPEFLL